MAHVRAARATFCYPACKVAWQSERCWRLLTLCHTCTQAARQPNQFLLGEARATPTHTLQSCAPVRRQRLRCCRRRGRTQARVRWRAAGWPTGGCCGPASRSPAAACPLHARPTNETAQGGVSGPDAAFQALHTNRSHACSHAQAEKPAADQACTQHSQLSNTLETLRDQTQSSWCGRPGAHAGQQAHPRRAGTPASGPSRHAPSGGKPARSHSWAARAAGARCCPRCPPPAAPCPHRPRFPGLRAQQSGSMQSQTSILISSDSSLSALHCPAPAVRISAAHASAATCERAQALCIPVAQYHTAPLADIVPADRNTHQLQSQGSPPAGFLEIRVFGVAKPGVAKPGLRTSRARRGPPSARRRAACGRPR